MAVGSEYDGLNDENLYEYADTNEDYVDERNKDFYYAQEAKNKKLVLDEIEDKTAYQVYHEEPKKNQEIENQEKVAAMSAIKQQIKGTSLYKTDQDEKNDDDPVLNLKLDKALESLLDLGAVATNFLQGEELKEFNVALHETRDFRKKIKTGAIKLNKERKKIFLDVIADSKFAKKKVGNRDEAVALFDFVRHKVVPMINRFTLISFSVVGNAPIHGPNRGFTR